MIRPAIRTTLYKEVIRQIIELIKAGEWKPGERILGEIELARRFAVSRNCVREALKALGHAGMIESKSGAGTFLTQDALHSIRRMEAGQLVRDDTSPEELLEARLIVEPQLAKLAAQRATEDDIARLEMAAKRARQAVKTNTYAVHLCLEFHMIVAEIARNRVLMRLFHSIAEELRVQRGALILSHLSEGDLLRELREHERILACIKRRDAARAAKSTTGHLRTALRILRAAHTARRLPSAHQGEPT